MIVNIKMRITNIEGKMHILQKEILHDIEYS